MKRYLYGLLAGLFWLSSIAFAQLEDIEDYVQAVTAYLQEQTGEVPQSQEVWNTLNSLVVKAYQDGDYRTGLRIAEQTYRYAEESFGPEHPNTLVNVNDLAVLYRAQGRYREAEPLYQRALSAREKELGPEHPATLVSVNNLASLYSSQGRYGEAEPLYLRSLAAREKVLGPEHPDTLRSVNNLAALYDSQGRYGEAEPLYLRALAASEKVLGSEHPDTLVSVNNLAFLYSSQGRYGEAEPLYLRSLAAREKVLGPGHPDTLQSVNNLAGLYDSQGRYGEAEPLYLRALAASEKVLGPEHPDTLVSVNNLAGLYRAQGRYGEAEPLYLRALAASEKVLGPEHPNTLGSVNNLALLYSSQGRYGEAEPLFLHALAAREKVLGPEHPDTLVSVNNLAGLYRAQGRYGEAEPLFQRALAAREKVLGPEHPDTLQSVNNLAILYSSQGHYGEAEPLYLRALAASEKVLGLEHPSTLGSVNNLAGLYESQGRYGEAELLYQRALAASEKVLGPEHPDTINVQLNYVATLMNLDQPERALRLLERLEPRLLDLAALRLRHTRQERVRRIFLADQSVFQNFVLTLALAHPDPEYAELAARVLIRWKQIQGEEEAVLARFVRSPASSNEVKALAGDIAGLRKTLTQLVHDPEPDVDLQRTQLNELEAKESRLAQISRRFKRHLEVRNADVYEMRAALPRDEGGLLELRRYHPRDFKTGEWGEPRWVALLLSASGERSLHDLGPVADTYALWQTLRKTNSEKDAAALYQNLFGALDERLKTFKTLYIAPDSFLNLIAFNRLVTPEGDYWIERDQHLRQVRTGRHLIASYDNDLDKPKGMLVLGGVNYEDFSGEATVSTAAAAVDPESLPPLDGVELAMRALGDQFERFRPLQYTDNEANEVANAYWDYWNTEPTRWIGAQATEANLKNLATPPSILHLATHGFYLKEDDNLVDRPMVLSGLALAGANRGINGERDEHGEDGILYALEAQDLNLEDTELVTLSACDTGHGTLDYSEGVYGLARAFRIAGARHVLISLWSVGDASTREFMARFYRTWLDGVKPKDLAVALRETQLSFIGDDNEDWRDPRVWAPFVLVEAR